LQELLKNIPLFENLNENELQKLQEISHIKEYKPRELLFKKDEILKELIILIDGNAYIYKENKQNKEIVIGYFYNNSILAEPPTLNHLPVPSSCRFITDSTVLKIDLEKFENLFMENHIILNGIIKSLLKKIQLLQQNIQINIETSAKDKILEFYKNSFTLSIDLKKYEIAAIIGISPSTFSRYAKELVNEKKLIKIEGGYKYSNLQD
jgi:CRP/FNR family transcriptional regulator